MSEKYLGENSTPLLINQIKENCTQKRSTLPIASIDELGHIYQYMGTTSGSLVHGYFYECVSDGAITPTYSWQQVNVQPTAGTPTASGTTFDNTTSGLQATNVQDAIDEVDGRVDNIEGKVPSTATSSNKLVDHDSLGTAAFKDSTDRVSPNNTALVESQSVYSAINTALSSIYKPRGDIACAELTSDLLIAANVGNVYETSDSGTTTALFLQGAGHPIATGDNVGIINAGEGRILFNLMANAFDLTDYQKKDLTSAIEGQTTVEGALSALSTNKATQTEVNDIVNVLGAKNLFDGSIVTTTAKGVTFTQNADGTISVTGYNTQGSSLGIFANHIQKLKAGSYVLSGCPSPTSGGLHIQLSDNDAGILIAEIYDGNEVSFTLNADTNCKIMYWASGDLSITGTLIIKPMIRLASDPDSTYVPYAMTNQQLTAKTDGLWDNMMNNGAVNLLENVGTTTTVNGITFTVNSDGTVTANGTATANAVLKISDRFTLADYIGRKYVDAKKNEASSSTYSLIITYRNGSGAYVNETYVPTEGFILSTISNATLVEFGVFVKSGQSVSNLTFEPMITVASYNGDYVPYAMTNQQITPYAQAISNPNLLDNPWFTVNQRGITNDWTTQFAYGVDRWRKQTSVNNTLQITDNGISATTSSVIGIYQVFKQADVKDLYGRILTFSVMYGDGTIESGSGLLPLDHYLPSSTKQKQFISNTTKCNYVQTESYSNGNLNIVVNTKAGTTIKAVKLELGSVSTLAMDTAPNYATELLKCQRYFYAFNGKPNLSGHSYAIIGTGYATSANNIRVPFYLPVEMRIVPTVSVSALSDVVIMSEVADSAAPSAIAIDSASCDRNNIGLFNITSDGNFVKGHSASVYAKNGCRIDLSADL